MQLNPMCNKNDNVYCHDRHIFIGIYIGIDMAL